VSAAFVLKGLKSSTRPFLRDQKKVKQNLKTVSFRRLYRLLILISIGKSCPIL